MFISAIHLNAVDTKALADLFPTQSCAVYNLQDGQAREPSHPFPSAAPQKSSPGREKQTTKTLYDQSSVCV